MAQHDMIIDNGPGAAVRADFNAVVQALVTQSSGTVEPTIKYAGQLWLDTSVAPNGQLRMRNQANNAWTTPIFDQNYPFITADMALVNRTASIGVNDKADGSGNDVMTLKDTGELVLKSAVVPYNAVTGQSIVATASGAAGLVILRPNGPALTSGQFAVSSDGNVQAAGTISSGGTTTGLAMKTVGAANSYQWFTGYHFDVNGTTGQATLYLQLDTARSYWTVAGGFHHLTANAYKTGGGAWLDPSDERIKNVVGEYALGLAEVVQLRPVRYVFKGNDTPTAPAKEAMPYVDSNHYQAAIDAQEFIGLVAQEVETVFPEMVTLAESHIDGQPVNDLRVLDTSSLLFALVNAVKELAAKVDGVEGGVFDALNDIDNRIKSLEVPQ